VQAAQPVVDGVARGQHHDAGVAVPAHDVEQGETVAAGQHDVEHDQVRPERRQVVLQAAPVRAPGGTETGLAEAGDHGGADRLGVLHHQHARGHGSHSPDPAPTWPEDRLKVWPGFRSASGTGGSVGGDRATSRGEQ
jgi:hypothetical protein